MPPTRTDADSPVPSVSVARPLAPRALAELVGTAFLLATVVGSGIMGERLSEGNAAVALLANSIATGAGLVALILAFTSVSGAHLNPAVTLMEALRRVLPWRDVPAYIGCQIAGAFGGVAAANAMFGVPLLHASRQARAEPGQVFAELLATLGLLLVIRGATSLGTFPVAIAVGAYIAAAYWFTSSTSFANPAVTLARTVTDSFAGIRPADAPAFIAAQLSGVVVALPLAGLIFPQPARDRRRETA